MNRHQRDRMVNRMAWWSNQIGITLSDPLYRLQLSVAVLLLFFFVGIVGYMLIEGLSPADALYMTVITVTTVGFGDIVPTTPLSRIFTVVLILLGLGAVTTAVSNGLALIAGQRLWRAVQQRRLNEVLRMLENHYIVAGYGRIGKQIVRDIVARGESCVVIDSNPDIQDEEYLIDENIPFIIGDATEDAVLERAGITRALGMLAALPSDADNVLAVLTARGLKESLFIVARSSEVATESKLRRAGANQVISPYQVGGHRMAMALMRPAVHDFLDRLSDTSDAESYDIGQVTIHGQSPMLGQSIARCDLRSVRGLTILALIRANRLQINPNPQLEFQEGDQLIVIGPPSAIYTLESDNREGRQL